MRFFSKGFSKINTANKEYSDWLGRNQCSFPFLYKVSWYYTHECSAVQRFGLDFPGFKQQHIDKMWNLKNYLFQLAKKSRELFTNRSRCRAWGRIWKECSSLWQARKLGCTKLVQGRVVNEVLWKIYEWKGWLEINLGLLELYMNP